MKGDVNWKVIRQLEDIQYHLFELKYLSTLYHEELDTESLISMEYRINNLLDIALDLNSSKSGV